MLLERRKTTVLPLLPLSFPLSPPSLSLLSSLSSLSPFVALSLYPLRLSPSLSFTQGGGVSHTEDTQILCQGFVSLFCN